MSFDYSDQASRSNGEDGGRMEDILRILDRAMEIVYAPLHDSFSGRAPSAFHRDRMTPPTQ